MGTRLPLMCRRAAGSRPVLPRFMEIFSTAEFGAQLARERLSRSRKRRKPGERHPVIVALLYLQSAFFVPCLGTLPSDCDRRRSFDPSSQVCRRSPSADPTLDCHGTVAACSYSFTLKRLRPPTLNGAAGVLFCVRRALRRAARVRIRLQILRHAGPQCDRQAFLPGQPAPCAASPPR